MSTMETDSRKPEITPGAHSVDRFFGPFEVVRFENGLQVMLDEDGRLRVIAEARGVHRIVILPTSDNSCRIEPIGKMYRHNGKDHRP